MFIHFLSPALKAVMLRGWEGNRRFGVALAMRHIGYTLWSVDPCGLSQRPTYGK